MEISCTRCHHTVQTEDCYCPVCGLPQLVYTADGSAGPGQPDRWNEAVRDAGSVDWKSALRSALMLAVPAGILCPMLYPIGFFGLFLMALAAAWVVVHYVRSQRPAWITIGAGARIGLATGLMSSALAATMIGASMFSMRFFFHDGQYFDDLWQDQVIPKLIQQWNSMGVDAPSIAILKAWVISPAGKAGSILGGVLFLAAAMLVFAVAGGALGARMMARSRRPEI